MILIPTILTIVFIMLMFRPTENSSSLLGDTVEMMIRGFYLIPISVTWALYFGILLLLKQ